MRKMLLILAAMLMLCAIAGAETLLTLSDAEGELPEGVTREGAVYTITQPGDYRVVGELTDGQLAVDSERNGKITLILDNVTIHNETGPAIYIRKGSPRVSISLEDHSTNTLTTGTKYTLESGDEPNGAIFSRSDLTITGNGVLTVDAGFMDGIVSKDDLRFKGGDITVTAARHGVRGKDYVSISEGTLNIRAAQDGIRSTNKNDPDRGYVEILGGSIHILCGDDPISVETKLIFTGGELTAEIRKASDP